MCFKHEACSYLSLRAAYVGQSMEINLKPSYREGYRNKFNSAVVQSTQAGCVWNLEKYNDWPVSRACYASCYYSSIPEN